MIHPLRYLLAFLCLIQVALSAEKPNVIVIFADDLGYGDLGCYGATKVKTPHIDKLAAEGRRFTDGHSASAVCTPSRYGLVTGEYPHKAMGGKGLWGPCSPLSEMLIDPSTFTIADVFKSKGYATGCIGKWHLGFKKGENDWKEPISPGPNNLGFDYYFGMPVVNSSSPYIYVENDKIVGGDPSDPLKHVGKIEKGAPLPPEVIRMPELEKAAGKRSENRFTGGKKAHELFIEEEVGPTFTEKTVDWIDQNKESPFFLYLATTHIHHPFTPAPQFKGSSEAGLYGDFIQELDWMVGEIVSALEERGLADDTMILFTSDNGGMFNHGGQDAFDKGHRQNGDLLGVKFGVWEGGHRVPFIAKWTGHIPAGTESDQLVSTLDLLATFAAIVGLDLTPEQQKDSINVLPAFTGDPSEDLRDHLILCPNKKTHLSVRQGDWVYIPQQGAGGWQSKGGHTFAGAPAASHTGKINSDIENGKIKKDAPTEQLYNLREDVSQTRNVIQDHPEVAAELKKLLY